MGTKRKKRAKIPGLPLTQIVDRQRVALMLVREGGESIERVLVIANRLGAQATLFFEMPEKGATQIVKGLHMLKL